MNVISRKAASAQGLTEYFTGTPCKNGHTAPRRVNGGCVTCVAERLRAWRKADPERAYASARVWRAANKERIAALNKRYGEQNVDRRREQGRKRAGLPDPTRPVPLTCESCDGPPNGNRTLVLDHDHETGAFRGWLCNRCNRGVGLIGDTLDAARKMVAYLERAGST